MLLFLFFICHFNVCKKKKTCYLHNFTPVVQRLSLYLYNQKYALGTL